MRRVSTINCRTCRWNEKNWTLSQVIWNLSVFEVWPHKLGVQGTGTFIYFRIASVVREGTHCCFITVDHHKRRQTDKLLLESYDEFFAFLNRQLYGRTSILVVHSWTGYQWKHYLIVWLDLMSSIVWFVLKREACTGQCDINFRYVFWNLRLYQ